MGKLTLSLGHTRALAIPDIALRGVVVLALAVSLVGCARFSPPPPEAHQAAQALVDMWLNELSGGSDDAGWDALSSSLQAEFGGHPATYIRAVADSQWDEFRWAVEPESSWDDGDYTVFVRLENAAPEKIPAVLRDYALAGPWYEANDLIGIVVFVGEPAFEGLRIMGGGASDWPDTV